VCDVKILPVIMCGGSGTRMWPESRERLPKQFIPLIGQRSTFQTIVSLVGDSSVFDPAVVITNYEYRFRVAEQLREIGAEAAILLEPDRRDSAAAVGAAAVWAAAHDPKTVVAVLAADHVFEDGNNSLSFARRPTRSPMRAKLPPSASPRPCGHRLRLHPSGPPAGA
jgi:mannose-1-phosphate guanylyltransferase/mannose-6-phosphate isomerase